MPLFHAVSAAHYYYTSAAFSAFEQRLTLSLHCFLVDLTETVCWILKQCYKQSECFKIYWNVLVLEMRRPFHLLCFDVFDAFWSHKVLRSSAILSLFSSSVVVRARLARGGGLKSHDGAGREAGLQRAKAQLLLQLGELSQERLLLQIELNTGRNFPQKGRSTLVWC